MREFDAAEAAPAWAGQPCGARADLLDAALGLASTLTTKPPLTIAAALTAVNRGIDAPIDDGLAIEERAFARIVPIYDAREGLAAFVEKRRPAFLGR